MRESFKIGDVEVPPGGRQSLSLNLPHQSTYTTMTMPVHIIHGKRSGPVLFVSAAIHGDEITGVEITRILLKNRALNRLRGTLICVPIVNVFGFLTHSRYLPDRRDLNRSFPGTKHGSLTSRVAYTFTEEIVKKCTHGIDLHSGAYHRTNHPHIRANLDDPETYRLARAFGTPVIVNANLRDGSLRQYAADRGITMLLYEAGEALRFDALSVKAGVRGVLNVMQALEMIAQRKRPEKERTIIEARSSTWVRAPESGIFSMTSAIGSRVKEGDRLGTISDAFGVEETAVTTPVTGIIVGRTNMPVINEGDALFHIAQFSNSKTVETAIEAFHAENIEGLGPGDYIDESVA